MQDVFLAHNQLVAVMGESVFLANPGHSVQPEVLEGHQHPALVFTKPLRGIS